jgi:hypothetical protein
MNPMDVEPIKIIGIVTEELGIPRNDGTPGSALYAVPVRLSRPPSSLWAELFVRTWDHPPSFTTRHRPGICRVVGDQVILDGTTVEELAEVHKETLKLVLDLVNQEVVKVERESAQRQQREAQAAASQRERIVDAAKQISFDN